MTETYAAIRHTFASTFYVDDELTPTMPLCPDQPQPLPSTGGLQRQGVGAHLHTSGPSPHSPGSGSRSSLICLRERKRR